MERSWRSARATFPRYRGTGNRASSSKPLFKTYRYFFVTILRYIRPPSICSFPSFRQLSVKEKRRRERERKKRKKREKERKNRTSRLDSTTWIEHRINSPRDVVAPLPESKLPPRLMMSFWFPSCNSRIFTNETKFISPNHCVFLKIQGEFTFKLDARVADSRRKMKAYCKLDSSQFWKKWVIKTNLSLERHVFDNFDISLHKTAPSCSFVIGQSLDESFAARLLPPLPSLLTPREIHCATNFHNEYESWRSLFVQWLNSIPTGSWNVRGEASFKLFTSNVHTISPPL